MSSWHGALVKKKKNIGKLFTFTDVSIIPLSFGLQNLIHIQMKEIRRLKDGFARHTAGYS
jgi:hypothetical protein